jgi:Na+:H+ antiporter, NhaC family
MTEKTKQPSLLDSLIPVVALIVMLFTSVKLYGDSSSLGANQIALLLAAAIAMLVGFKNGFTWKQMESGVIKGISMALGAILILLMVGSLIGTWILAGTVPTMIYFGLQLMEPSIFYAATCVICCLVSISIGSSWTTAGTIGVALIGIAAGLDLSMPITAGAIISGAYFGDKMSPLSDTTNLAPAITGTDLFTHIRHMAWTTGPSIVIAIILFTIIGLTEDTVGKAANLQVTLNAIDSHFSVSLLSLLPLAVVLFLAYKKMPAFPTLLIGALLGGVFAIVFQPDSTEAFIGDARYSCQASSNQGPIESCTMSELDTSSVDVSAHFTIFSAAGQVLQSREILGAGDQSQHLLLQRDDESITVQVEKRPYILNAIDGVWRAMASGFVSTTGDERVDNLLSRGGMVQMLNPTVWLILCAMTFGAILETVGLLQRLVTTALTMVKGTGSLVVTVICTCIGINIIAADQYIAIVLPGRMYRAEFKRRHLHPKNLSRVLEDSATITSPLIPWNTCGAFMAGTLGVSTFAYMPFCFFNIVNPFVSIIYGITNFKIIKIDEEEGDGAMDASVDSKPDQSKQNENAVLNQG